jgi:hypothetical protein
LATPDYFCADGQTVTVRWADRPEATQPIAHDSNTAPGWEVAGGLILSALLDSPEVKIIFNPPPQFSLKWSYGDTKQWQGEQVQDVVIAVAGQQNMQEMHLYVSPDGKRLVGFSTMNGGKPAWAHYVKQVENETLPKGVGTAPAARS